METSSFFQVVETVLPVVAHFLDPISLARMECVSQRLCCSIKPLWGELAKTRVLDATGAELSAKDRVVRWFIAERFASRMEKLNRRHYFQPFPRSATNAEEQEAERSACKGCTEMPDLDLDFSSSTVYFVHFAYHDRVAWQGFVEEYLLYGDPQRPQRYHGIFLSLNSVIEQVNTSWPGMKSFLDFLANTGSLTPKVEEQRDTLKSACFDGLALTIVKMARTRPWIPSLVMATKKSSSLIERSMSSVSNDTHFISVSLPSRGRLAHETTRRFPDLPAWLGETYPEDPHYETFVHFPVGRHRMRLGLSVRPFHSCLLSPPIPLAFLFE